MIPEYTLSFLQIRHHSIDLYC